MSLSHYSFHGIRLFKSFQVLHVQKRPHVQQKGLDRRTSDVGVCDYNMRLECVCLHSRLEGVLFGGERKETPAILLAHTKRRNLQVRVTWFARPSRFTFLVKTGKALNEVFCFTSAVTTSSLAWKSYPGISSDSKFGTELSWAELSCHPGLPWMLSHRSGERPTDTPPKQMQVHHFSLLSKQSNKQQRGNAERDNAYFVHIFFKNPIG